MIYALIMELYWCALLVIYFHVCSFSPGSACHVQYLSMIIIFLLICFRYIFLHFIQVHKCLVVCLPGDTVSSLRTSLNTPYLLISIFRACNDCPFDNG